MVEAIGKLKAAMAEVNAATREQLERASRPYPVFGYQDQ